MSIRLLHGDCLIELPKLAAAGERFHAVVTDPPYHLTSMVKRLSTTTSDDVEKNFTKTIAGQKANPHAAMARGFMGKTWDGGNIAQSVELWRAVYEVMLPGAHLFAFGGTRTSHRMVCAIEDAGFEIRDTVAWLYGCLDTATEAVTPDGVRPYHKLSAGDPVLCYDPSDGGYSYQPVLEVVEYDYDDTAFRIVGDFGEQVVTRNHRCIVERGGVESFQFAEEAAREREARVPILEGLPELQDALCGADQGAGNPQQGMFTKMRGGVGGCPQQRHDAARDAQGQSTGDMLELRCDILAQREVAGARGDSDVFKPVQRGSARRAMGNTWSQGRGGGNPSGAAERNQENDGCAQSSMERRPDLSQSEGQIRRATDQVCPVPSAVSGDGAQGRICDGASADRSGGYRATADARRDSPSPEPQGDGERTYEPDAIRDERGSQVIRAWRGHRSALVRVLPFHLTGKVWCLRVPTGAFVAVRGGVAFPTGNSGFPKSLDVSKAIDRAAGAERQVIARRSAPVGFDTESEGGGGWKAGEIVTTAPATAEAAQWQGWGTALKPAFEPIVVARKPLDGTVAANVLKHECGGLNIDASRVGLNGDYKCKPNGRPSQTGLDDNYDPEKANLADTLGRWPANVVHDGSEEVLAAFPDAPGQLAFVGEKHGKRDSVNCYGDYGARPDTPPRVEANKSAARFFYQAKSDVRCGLCNSLYDRESGNQFQCDASNAATKPSDQTGDFAPSNAAELIPQEREGSGSPRPGHVPSVGVPSSTILPLIDGIAQPSATMSDALKIVQNVKAAADLCNSCATDIARVLAEVRHNGSAASSVFRCSIDDYKKTILTQCLASHVAHRESTDIIVTTTSLKLLFGSVFHAIAENTNSDASEPITRSELKRLWYSSKADKADRADSKHPTVKPVDLIRWLVTLACPPGGHVLDCFAGSGTTGEACMLAGFDCTLIEREAQHARDIEHRIKRWSGLDAPLFADAP